MERHHSQIGLGCAHQRRQLSLILAPHFLNRQHRGCLLVHGSTKPCFTLDDDVGHPHLAAQSGEENDELDRVNVVRDNDELGFLRLDESDDVVQPILDEQRLFGVLWFIVSLGTNNNKAIYI